MSSLTPTSPISISPISTSPLSTSPISTTPSSPIPKSRPLAPAPLTLAVEPPPLKGLLGLPREIRDQIYHYALVEPPKWKKHHQAHCEFAPRDSDVLERPPFCLRKAVWSDEKQGDVIVHACRCASRKGLGLLRANRQLHNEAAPVFWSMNLHCFSIWAQFVADVKDRLRPEYRDMIRYVSIMDEFGEDAHVDRSELWSTVLLCRGLRKLEVRPEYCTRHLDLVASVARMPSLKTFFLCTLLSYDLTTPRLPFHCFRQFDAATEKKRRKVLFRLARPHHPRDLAAADDCKEALRAFTTNFVVHGRFEVRRSLLLQPEFNCWRDTPLLHRYRKLPHPDIDDTHDSVVLTLRDGVSTTVHVYGVHLSHVTRLRHSRERWSLQQRLLARNLPTPQQERLRLEMRQRRRSKLDRKAEEDARDQAIALALRRARNEERLMLEARLARTDRETERQERERIIEAAKGERKGARKAERSLRHVAEAEGGEPRGPKDPGEAGESRGGKPSRRANGAKFRSRTSGREHPAGRMAHG